MMIYDIGSHPRFDRCGCEIEPGVVNYCMPDIERSHEVANE